MKKKFVALLLAGTMALSLSACGGSDSDSSDSSSTGTEAKKEAKKDESNKEKSKEKTEDVSDSDAESADVSDSGDDYTLVHVGDSLEMDFDVMGPSSFPNDVTGNWYETYIMTTAEFQQYALCYYKTYFTSDSELHVVYNFTNNTVNVVTKMGSLLDVRVLDYVDGEEQDASAACGGTLLAEYHVNIDAGTIEQIQ